MTGSLVAVARRADCTRRPARTPCSREAGRPRHLPLMYLGAKHMVTATTISVPRRRHLPLPTEGRRALVSLFTSAIASRSAGVLGGIRADPPSSTPSSGSRSSTKRSRTWTAIFGVQPNTRGGADLRPLPRVRPRNCRRSLRARQDRRQHRRLSFVGVEIAGLALTFIIALTFWRTRADSFTTPSRPMRSMSCRFCWCASSPAISHGATTEREHQPPTTELRHRLAVATSTRCWYRPRTVAFIVARGFAVDPSAPAKLACWTGPDRPAVAALKPKGRGGGCRPRAADAAFKQESVTFQLKPHEGIEYRYRLGKGEALLSHYFVGADERRFHASPTARHGRADL